MYNQNAHGKRNYCYLNIVPIARITILKTNPVVEGMTGGRRWKRYRKGGKVSASDTVASSDYGYRGRTQMRANVTSHLYGVGRKRKPSRQPTIFPRANGGHPIRATSRRR